MKKSGTPAIGALRSSGSEGVRDRSPPTPGAFCLARSAPAPGPSLAPASPPAMPLDRACARRGVAEPLGLAPCACSACTCGACGSAAGVAVPGSCSPLGLDGVTGAWGCDVVTLPSAGGLAVVVVVVLVGSLLVG